MCIEYTNVDAWECNFFLIWVNNIYIFYLLPGTYTTCHLLNFVLLRKKLVGTCTWLLISCVLKGVGALRAVFGLKFDRNLKFKLWKLF